jgi:glucose-6-phosphate dehydrogenase assembly protein OpcA
VELIAHESGLVDVAPVVRSLLAPDLPVVLWCRGRRLLELPDFQPMLRLANKVIVDSAGVADLAGQLELLQRARSQDRFVGDLAWTRLTRWRESIAQIFDNPAYLDRIEEIREVHIDYEGAHLPMSACYLAAWFSHVLLRELQVEYRRVGDCARARVHTVALGGNGLDVSIAVSQDRAVELHAGVRDTHTVFPPLSDHELLGEELAVLGRDPVYDEVVRLAPQFIRHSA